MSVKYSLRQDTVIIDAFAEQSYGVDAIDESGQVVHSVTDVSFDRKAVEKLIENLNEYQIELVHLMDVVYDFYHDHC